MYTVFILEKIIFILSIIIVSDIGPLVSSEMKKKQIIPS